MTTREKYLVVAGTAMGLVVAGLFLGGSRLIWPGATSAKTEQATTPSAYESTADNAPAQLSAREHGSDAAPKATEPLSSLQLSEDEQRSIGLQTTVVQRRNIHRELLVAARVEEPETQLATISARVGGRASTSCTWISPGNPCGVASRLPRYTVQKSSRPPRSTNWLSKTASSLAAMLSPRRVLEPTI